VLIGARAIGLVGSLLATGRRVPDLRLDLALEIHHFKNARPLG
jgi:hypothetical protein